ncbi:MAG: hypothetical protein J0J05_05210 [Microbacterium sp.]|uniref:hypothetical protein n=1 Tax=Microbacterium sp. TaxID=51671 RepID=UPI001AC9934D|nr:hypothetical protein [Microbacterium sp.]MBN9153362.1 hypothetical protein [Microbacterium sp.]
MRAARGALVALGVATLGVGVFFLTTSLTPARLVWVGVWLAACVILHDGVLVPLLSLLRARIRRLGRTWPPAVLPVIESGFAVAATIILFVVPELWAQHRGNPNPTILQGAYADRLVVVVAVIAVVVTVTVRILVRRSRADGERGQARR